MEVRSPRVVPITQLEYGIPRMVNHCKHGLYLRLLIFNSVLMDKNSRQQASMEVSRCGALRPESSSTVSVTLTELMFLCGVPMGANWHISTGMVQVSKL